MEQSIYQATQEPRVSKHRIVFESELDVAIPCQPYCVPLCTTPNPKKYSQSQIPVLVKQIHLLAGEIKLAQQRIKTKQQVQKDIKRIMEEQRASVLQGLQIKESIVDKHKGLLETRKIAEYMNIKSNQLKQLSNHYQFFRSELRELGQQIKGNNKQIEQKISQFNHEILQVKNQIQQYTKRKSSYQDKNAVITQKLQDKAFDIEKLNFHKYVLNLQLMKNFRPGLHIHQNSIVGSNLADYTVLQPQKDLEVDLMQIVYYVTSNLYPKFKKVLQKAMYESRCFEILLRGDVQPQMSSDLKRKVTSQLDRKSMKQNSDPFSRDQAILIIFAFRFSNHSKQFKNLLFQHLLGFNNQIIHIRNVQSHTLSQQLEEINIIYSFGLNQVTRKVYILDLKNASSQQIVSIFDSTQKSSLSPLLDSKFENRKGYLFVELPLFVLSSQMKQYEEIIKTLKNEV